MLDAGYAKEKHRDPNIKHVTHFENRTICKLLNSPDYLGRGYSRNTKEPEKYIKNKQICKLIDEIRYNGTGKIRESRKHLAKLHHKEFTHQRLNGGNACAYYGPSDRLDLGNAGPKCGEVLVPHVFHLERVQKICEIDESSAILYTNFIHKELNGGNANTYYEHSNRLDLGYSNTVCEKESHLAELHDNHFIHKELNGGCANTSYKPSDHLDLGTAGHQSKSEGCLAELHDTKFIHKEINGGNSNTSYSLADRLDLGDASPKCKLIPQIEHLRKSCGSTENLAILHYNEFIYKEINGGYANTSYGPLERLNLGDAGIKCETPLPIC